MAGCRMLMRRTMESNPERRQTRARLAALHLAALGLSALMALIALEGLTRWFVPDPDLAFENRLALFVEDPDTGYRNRGGYHAWAQGVIEVGINSLGFRGPEISLRKSPGSKRILGLGDSVAFGTGVQERETFLRRLEGVNLSVIGYSLHQEVVTLRKFGLPLKGDIALLNFVVNDAYPTEDPFFNVQRLHRPEKRDVRRREYADPRPAPSYFYRLALNLFRRWREGRGPQAAPAPLWPEGGYELRAWPFMQEDFRAFARMGREESLHGAVVLFPTRAQLEAKASGPVWPQSMIEEFLSAEGIPFLDLREALRGSRGMLLDEMHLSPAGHAATARAIGAFLQERGW